MSFCSFSKDNNNLGKTSIDNLFFTNYLPDAPENAVKVYLYGLFLCSQNLDLTVENMSQILNISINDVKDCFKFWEEYGLISIISNTPYTVNYLPINEQGSHYKRFKPEKYEDFTKAIQVIITDRMISINEFNSYFQLMENSTLKPEALIMICKYCVDVKGGDISYKYIMAVAKDFVSRGVTTPELVEKELSCYFSKSMELGEVFRALKLTRKHDVEDIQLYKKWSDKYGFEHNYILSIIKIFKVKSVKILDKTIEELYSNKLFTDVEAKEYYKNKESLFNLAKEINKTLGIYIEVLDNVVISYVSPWISFGFTNKSLLFIANYCFKKNKRSLELMDETVKNLYKQGLITVENITDFMRSYTENDKFISIILENVGVQRKPTDWDRENLKIWRSWNFTDDIILEASKRSAGIRNFIPYMSTILADWKSKNAFTIEDINKIAIPKQNKDVIHFENERKPTKDELDSLFDAFNDFKV